MAKRKINREELDRATRARIAEEYQCAKCGRFVDVRDGWDWDDGDLCDECYRQQAERDIAAKDAEIENLQRRFESLYRAYVQLPERVQRDAEMDRLRELLREARDAMLHQGAYQHMGPHRLAEEIGKALGLEEKT